MARTTRCGTKHRETDAMILVCGVDVEDVPFDRLFYPWQQCDWRMVNEQIESGRAARLTGLSGPVEQWERCALEELGRLRISVVFDDNARELWILPRSATSSFAVGDVMILT